jgi:hypothetical protein
MLSMVKQLYSLKFLSPLCVWFIERQ